MADPTLVEWQPIDDATVRLGLFERAQLFLARYSDGPRGGRIRGRAGARSRPGRGVAVADEVTPFPKSVQLSRGERRYRRKVASPKQWQALSAAKMGPCRVCWARTPVYLELHHLVSREDHGGDVADNLVPICSECHDAITRRVETVARLLLSRLSDAEYAYMVQRGGEDYAERAYGIEYGR